METDDFTQGFHLHERVEQKSFGLSQESKDLSDRPISLPAREFRSTAAHQKGSLLSRLLQVEFGGGVLFYCQVPLGIC